MNKEKVSQLYPSKFKSQRNTSLNLTSERSVLKPNAKSTFQSKKVSEPKT